MRFTQTEKLRAIGSGDIAGEEAVDVLRLALVECYKAEAEAGLYRMQVSQAELRLLYGEQGRHEKSPVFISSVG